MNEWPIVDMEPVRLPTLPAQHDELWAVLVELSDLRPGEWTVIGGQVVFLHAMDHGAQPPRMSTDLDVLVNARVVTGGVREFVAAIEAAGFMLVGACPEGVGGQGRSLRRALDFALLDDGRLMVDSATRVSASSRDRCGNDSAIESSKNKRRGDHVTGAIPDRGRSRSGADLDSAPTGVQRVGNVDQREHQTRSEGPVDWTPGSTFTQPPAEHGEQGSRDRSDHTPVDQIRVQDPDFRVEQRAHQVERSHHGESRHGTEQRHDGDACTPDDQARLPVVPRRRERMPQTPLRSRLAPGRRTRTRRRRQLLQRSDGEVSQLEFYDRAQASPVLLTTLAMWACRCDHRCRSQRTAQR